MKSFDVRKAYVAPTQTIREIAKIISQAGGRIVLVVNADEQLQGVITDSDLRKAVVNGVDMDQPAKTIMVRHPVVADPNDSREDVLSLMREHNIYEIPRVNAAGKVLGIEFFHQLDQDQINDANVLVMAGGLGKRLHPLTLDVPKPMLPVRGVPMLERIVRSFVNEGFRQFYVSLCYRSDDFIEYFDRLNDDRMIIKWLIEEEPLGTAGSIAMIPSDDRRKDLIVSNADLDSDISYQSVLRYHREHQADVTIACKRYAYQIPFGVIDHKDGHVQSIDEKPEYVKYINGGLYVLSPSVYAHHVEPKQLDMPQVINQALGKAKKVMMYPLHEYWRDIGQIKEYHQANQKGALENV